MERRGQVREDVSMRVWPTLAIGLEPDGAAGHALIYAVHPWAWLWVATAPIPSPAFDWSNQGGKQRGSWFAPCDAVVPIASGVSRIGVGASLLIFLFVSLTESFSPCSPAWRLRT